MIGLGEAHPSGHGLLRLRLTLDGDVITAADPVIGYVHRGAEKLFEARDYRQIIVLANRHDWLGAFASELGVVLAAERLAGIEVPPRGVWARTLLAELNRVLSHLAFLGSYPPELVADGAEGTGPEDSASGAEGAGAARSADAAAQARELLQAIMEEISGGRMHYMFNRVGGLKEELPAGWLGRVGAAAAEVRAALPVIGAVVRGSAVFRARTRQAGVLSQEQVLQYGVSGPAARASGVDFDLRRDEPYLAYPELAGTLQVVTRAEGDSLARFECLLDQVAVSLDLIDAAASRLASLPPGPLSARIPKVLQDPGRTHLRLDRGPARGDRVLPGVPGRQDAVAAEAAYRVVQQRAGAGRDPARPPGGGPDRDPGLDVLRRGRHGPVARSVRGRPPVLDHERAPALPGDDQAALPEHLHGVPHRLVGDPVLLGQVPLGRQPMHDLAGFDPHLDVVRHLHIGEVGG